MNIGVRTISRYSPIQKKPEIVRFTLETGWKRDRRGRTTGVPTSDPGKWTALRRKHHSSGGGGAVRFAMTLALTALIEFRADDVRI